MKKMLHSKKTLLVSVLCVIAVIFGLAACAPKESTDVTETNGTESPEQVEMPKPDEFGVITADGWSDIYPDQYATYKKNLDNSPDSGKHNYLELYPALNTMYKGYGFSKGYDEASSHLYSLDSIDATPRINESSLAGCITCKSPQFTAYVNKEGDGVYAQPFADVRAMINEPISCYNCHENDPNTLATPAQFFVKGMGPDVDKVEMSAQVCGQCHNEYYFDPDTKVTTIPYNGLADMNSEDTLAYYDNLGFKDWEYEVTGTPMLKVQHPEFETIFGEGHESHMASIGYTCASCHMGSTTGEDGNTYTSHNWRSPLENEDLLENDCSRCHEDLASEVKAIQDASETRVVAISEKIEEMVNKFVAGVESGTLSDDDIAKLRTLHRSAQWYWDYTMVENSEGAHNSAYMNSNLDKAEALVDEALAML